MKPYFIYLIRHGESVGNADKSIYQTVPDWKIPLTKKGEQQAKEAAKYLQKDLKKYDKWQSGTTYLTPRGFPAMFPHNRTGLMLYRSPWLRARQTSVPIEKVFGVTAYEDPRLREQEWGNFAEPALVKKINRERRKFGSFFYRMPNGESGADTFDRVTTFIDTMHRDFEKKDFPVAAAIVTHGLTIKCFLTRWFHYSVEDFDAFKTPRNCEILKMALGDDGHYTLETPLRRRPSHAL